MYNIGDLVNELFDLLQLAGIDTRGFFLNADPGFDSDGHRSICIQEEIEANIKSNPRNTKKTNMNTSILITNYTKNELL